MSNPTPLQTDPNWSGHLMHPNSRGSRVHPNNRGTNERRHVVPGGGGGGEEWGGIGGRRRRERPLPGLDVGRCGRRCEGIGGGCQVGSRH
jgi:hypothetical protein